MCDGKFGRHSGGKIYTSGDRPAVNRDVRSGENALAVVWSAYHADRSLFVAEQPRLSPWKQGESKPERKW
jgi:hypothetical protein